MKQTDVQVGGTHYKDMKIQPIEFVLANNLDYCQGNIIKYVCRFRHKNGLDDLRKAMHYLEFLIEKEMEDEAEKAKSIKCV